MNDTQKNSLALLLLLAGLVVLSTTWSGSRGTQKPQRGDRAVHMPIDVKSLFTQFTFDPLPVLQPKKLLALFVLNANVCPPCLNEVAEYAELLENMRAQSIDVRALVLIFEADAYRASRFVKVSGLQMPAGYGYPPKLARLLGQDDEGLLLQQLVFIQLPEEFLFYRVSLVNGTTEIEAKRAVLQRMITAWEGSRLKRIR